jgi:transcriptional regulator with XRE-family HTH domain
LTLHGFPCTLLGMLNGPQLKKLRTARGLTQDELATMAGVSRATVACGEAGQLANPRIETVQKLARALDVPWVALLTDSSG